MAKNANVITRDSLSVVLNNTCPSISKGDRREVTNSRHDEAFAYGTLFTSTNSIFLIESSIYQ